MTCLIHPPHHHPKKWKEKGREAQLGRLVLVESTLGIMPNSNHDIALLMQKYILGRKCGMYAQNF